MATVSALESFVATYITSHKSKDFACDVHEKENPWKYVQDLFEKEMTFSKKSKKLKGRAVASMFAACLAMNAKIEVLNDALHNSNENLILKQKEIDQKEKEIDKLECKVSFLTSLNDEIKCLKEKSDENCATAQTELKMCKEKLIKTENEMDNIISVNKVIQNKLTQSQSVQNTHLLQTLKKDASTQTYSLNNCDKVGETRNVILFDKTDKTINLSLKDTVNSVNIGEIPVFLATPVLCPATRGNISNTVSNNHSTPILITTMPNSSFIANSGQHCTAQKECDTCVSKLPNYTVKMPQLHNDICSDFLKNENMDLFKICLGNALRTKTDIVVKVLELDILTNDLQSNRWVEIMDTINGFKEKQYCYDLPCKPVFPHFLEKQRYTWSFDTSHGSQKSYAKWLHDLNLFSTKSIFQLQPNTCNEEKHGGIFLTEMGGIFTAMKNRKPVMDICKCFLRIPTAEQKRRNNIYNDISL
ncbi:uncharacterized protein LOC128657766 [Bombina bombina]|uniref:uncharacterized protein LOC128657766 n=1 Tax=Bombina bombina TaxID=8345 RepID=UPI00235AA41F|nr:uncharacterized protein LOC128657766 [Bombina bombina]